MVNFNNSKNVIVIPARLGSNRVKLKNLRLLNGKPLISYVIDACKLSSLSKNIFVNSDSELFQNICNEKNISLYLRPKELATSQSLIDDYLYEFMSNTNYDNLILVNPTSPFISHETIRKAFESFLVNSYDTLIACENIQTHCFFKNETINFDIQGQHPRSQDLDPIKALNFAVSIWNTSAFKKNYKKNNYGVYTGKIGLYPIEGVEAIDIDYEKDFLLAEYVMSLSGVNSRAEYPDYVNEFLRINPDIKN